MVTWGNTTTRGYKTTPQLDKHQRQKKNPLLNRTLPIETQLSKAGILLPKVEASIFVYLSRRWGSRRSVPCGHSWRSGRLALSRGHHRSTRRARSTVPGRHHRPALSHGPYRSTRGARYNVPGRNHRDTGTTSSTRLTETFKNKLYNKPSIYGLFLIDKVPQLYDQCFDFETHLLFPGSRVSFTTRAVCLATPTSVPDAAFTIPTACPGAAFTPIFPEPAPTTCQSTYKKPQHTRSSL